MQIALKQLNLPEVDRLTIKNGIGLGEEEICHYLFGKDSDVTPEMFLGDLQECVQSDINSNV